MYGSFNYTVDSIGVGTGGGARGAMAPPLFHATTPIMQYSVHLTCLQSHGSLSNAASSAIERVRYTYKVALLDRLLTINLYQRRQWLQRVFVCPCVSVWN